MVKLQKLNDKLLADHYALQNSMETPSAGVTYPLSPDQVLMGGANEARLLAGGNADMLRCFALDSDVRILSHYSDTCVSIYGKGGIAGARKCGADMWAESLRWATQNKPMDKCVSTCCLCLRLCPHRVVNVLRLESHLTPDTSNWIFFFSESYPFIHGVSVCPPVYW